MDYSDLHQTGEVIVICPSPASFPSDWVAGGGAEGDGAAGGGAAGGGAAGRCSGAPCAAVTTRGDSVLLLHVYRLLSPPHAPLT